MLNHLIKGKKVKNMKIKLEHYEYMKKQIAEKVLVCNVANHRQWLKDNAKYKDLEVRLAWDFSHAAKLDDFICKTLYVYMHDDHVTTALKRIIKELDKE